MASDLISVNDASVLLDVSARSVRRWISDGRIPAYRVGSRVVRVKVSELTKLIEGSRITHTAP